MLLLKRHLIALVRAGKKNQTIRLWSHPRVRAGQLAYTPGLGRMLITSVEPLAGLSALTAKDARDDGFPSLRALRAELRQIYGRALPPGKRFYRVRFAWPPPHDLPPARSKKRKPQSRRRRTPPSHPGPDARRRLAEFLRHPAHPSAGNP